MRAARHAPIVAVAAVAAVVGTATGCVAPQSARVLAPGRTQVSVAAARVGSAAVPGDDTARSRWFGELVIRRGLGHRLDAAVTAVRTVGQFGAVYAVAVEPRLQVVPPRGRVTVAAGLTVGLAGAEYILVTDIEERRETRFEGTLLATSATVGIDVRPGVELVLVPRGYLLVRADDAKANQLGLGLVAGVRVTDPARTWAVHPALALSRVDGDTLVTIGVAVGVGD